MQQASSQADRGTLGDAASRATFTTLRRGITAPISRLDATNNSKTTPSVFFVYALEVFVSLYCS